MATSGTPQKKPVVLVLILTAIAVLGILAGLYQRYSSIHHAVEGFGENLAAHQYSQAYQYTGQEFQSYTTLAIFIRTQEDLTEKYGPLQEISAGHYRVWKSNHIVLATVQANMKFTSGTSLPYTFVLKARGNAWEIYSYKQQ